MPQNGPKTDVAHALKEAGVAGLIAFGMFLPLIGFHAVQDMHNDLVLETRWPRLAVFVILAMAARLFGSLVFTPWRARRAAAAQKAAAPQKTSALRTIALPLAAGFVVVYPLIVVWVTGLGGAVKWVDNFGIQILIYVMLGLGLNLVVGLAGLLDLG
jgi:branched-chain amino acid transport system permease protein